MIGVLTAVEIIGGIGLLIGLFLGVASIIFRVEVDEKEEAVLGALPGNNCGGCGFPGCSGLAAAIAKGEAAVNACPVGGEITGRKIAGIMGVEADAVAKQIAFVACRGDIHTARADYEYTGTASCAMQAFVPGGGARSCAYGCLGQGDCVRACPFDAIEVADGIARVKADKCKACSKCVGACPRNLISLIPYEAEYTVGCSSRDKGPVVTKVCEVGCIGCGICKRNCPAGAITVEEFCAVIDQERCTGCGVCQEKCPKKCIGPIAVI